MEWYLFIFSVLFFAAALGFMCIFRVSDVHIAQLFDLFRGRFSKKSDGRGYSIPLREPLLEGLHLKKPWQWIKEVSRETRTKPIKAREFPVMGGGSVKISGVIQYRPSTKALYRYFEVDEEGIEKGLDSELDQMVSQILGQYPMEEAITRKKEVNAELWGRLTGTIVNPDKPASERHERKLFGKAITYAEHSYGIEILKASIDVVEEASAELKTARHEKQKELYEKESQTTEFNHLRARMKELKQDFPGLDDNKVLEAIQIWQKQTKKEIREFQVTDLKALGEIVAGILAGIGGKK